MLQLYPVSPNHNHLFDLIAKCVPQDAPPQDAPCSTGCPDGNKKNVQDLMSVEVGEPLAVLDKTLVEVSTSPNNSLQDSLDTNGYNSGNTVGFSVINFVFLIKK